MMEKNGSLTSVDGFYAVGKAIGIKKSKHDLAVIYSDVVCECAGVFTKNKVVGAPVIVTKEHLMDGCAQAIVINSGIANVCTGIQGEKDAFEMAEICAKEIGVKKGEVLVASTGVIGKMLPMDKINAGLKGIKEELSKENELAKAILTTDLATKEVYVEGSNFKIGGVAKGSGMVHPNMATILSFIATDAEIDHKKLKELLVDATNESFNMMSVDMDTSTSDMCIVMANGKAGKVDEGEFKEALTYVCKDLAKKIAIDGEGATKLVHVKVTGAKTKEKAKKYSKAIISSNLVKCACYGNDPNWGRIFCAMGNTGEEFDINKSNILIGNIYIVKNGIEVPFDYKKVKSDMDKKKMTLTVELNDGVEESEAFGCDMTEKYIEINAHYHT